MLSIRGCLHVRRLRIDCIVNLRHLPLKVPVRTFHAKKLPFDVNSDLGDSYEKYKEFSEMYSSMFQGFDKNDAGVTLDITSDGDTSKKSELEELNEDFEDLVNVTDQVLTGQNLYDIVSKPGRFIVQSLSHDPYYNLALEDYIFRNTPLERNVTKVGGLDFQSQRLLFYVNSPCVVFGKNQVIWKEIYLRETQKRKYECLRRLSGGGAVVHDLGNVNYSYLTSRSQFETSYFNSLLVKWLNDFDSSDSYKLNKRGDMTFNGAKCSGSAYKISKGKAYHHGTMLINSCTDQFSGLLKPSNIDGVHWNTPSVESVRSRVSNINMNSTEQFIELCIDSYRNEINERIPIYYCSGKVTINNEIDSIMKKLKSEEWKFLTGPKFTVSFPKNAKFIEVEHGLITKSNIIGIQNYKFNEFVNKLGQSKTQDLRNLVSLLA